MKETERMEKDKTATVFTSSRSSHYMNRQPLVTLLPALTCHLHLGSVVGTVLAGIPLVQSSGCSCAHVLGRNRCCCTANSLGYAPERLTRVSLPLLEVICPSDFVGASLFRHRTCSIDRGPFAARSFSRRCGLLLRTP
ncbi:hypothetical protein CMQ_2802 [Grosmannia clavigera kw1407]|uniref:Uncharacterized protein n=1 Tax=Grosmannia clavigera (strain kw1407 / UAMH 11150) TaxID=655863 RepID=F0XH86_GROCL|nr:uncharacterized protein CMQ_2802 [Grosmannia clavigera kw1407]EFX02873.1 hypothetical protein CMQ_2802 [Grosmannia clavigera kw1407]